MKNFNLLCIGSFFGICAILALSTTFTKQTVCLNETGAPGAYQCYFLRHFPYEHSNMISTIFSPVFFFVQDFCYRPFSEEDLYLKPWTKYLKNIFSV